MNFLLLILLAVRSVEPFARIVRFSLGAGHARRTVESASTSASIRAGVVAAAPPSVNTSTPLPQSDPQLLASLKGQTVTLALRFTASERAVYSAPVRQEAVDAMRPFLTIWAKPGTPTDRTMAAIATATIISIRVKPRVKHSVKLCVKPLFEFIIANRQSAAAGPSGATNSLLLCAYSQSRILVLNISCLTLRLWLILPCLILPHAQNIRRYSQAHSCVLVLRTLIVVVNASRNRLSAAWVI